MTLIMTMTFENLVLQTSDRLVTWKTSRGVVSPMDQRANKTVLYKSKDGLATISFAGAAFIDDIPADEWLAETLYGRPLPRYGPNGRIAPIRIDDGQRSRHLNTLELIGFLREAIRKIPKDNLEFFGITICIGALYLQKGKSKHFRAELKRGPRSISVSVLTLGLSGNDSRGFVVGSGEKSAVHLYKNKCLGPPSIGMNWTNMIRITQLTAQIDKTVGGNVLGVALVAYKDVDGTLGVCCEVEHFFCDDRPTPSPSILSFGAHRTSITPWFVSERNAISPAHLINDYEHQEDHVFIRFVGEPSQSGLHYVFSSLTRPKNVAAII